MKLYLRLFLLTIWSGTLLLAFAPPAYSDDVITLLGISPPAGISLNVGTVVSFTLQVQYDLQTTASGKVETDYNSAHFAGFRIHPTNVSGGKGTVTLTAKIAFVADASQCPPYSGVVDVCLVYEMSWRLELYPVLRRPNDELLAVGATATYSVLSNGGVKIPDTTKVVDASTASQLTSISSDGSTLTFSGSTPLISSLSVNDVLVFGITPSTPNGLLRKITSIQQTGAQTIVTTLPGTLEQAITSGSVEFQGTLTPSGVISSTGIAGTMVRATDAAPSQVFSFTLNDLKLDLDGNPDTTNDDMVISSLTVTFVPRLDFGADFDFGLKAFHVTLNLEVQVEISKVVWPANLFNAIHFNDFKLPVGPPITFSGIPLAIGPVPLVLVPTLDFNLLLSGDVGPNLTFGGNLTSTYTFGVTYDRDMGLAPIFNSSTSLAPVVPEKSSLFDGQFTAKLGPELSFKIDDMAGPSLFAGPYAELDLHALDKPLWQLFQGLDFKGEVLFQIFTANIADVELAEEQVTRDLVASAPVAAFSAAPSSGQAPLQVYFDASGSAEPDPIDGITQYLWDFGDGSAGAGLMTSHTYNDPGTYTAKLTVIDQKFGFPDQSTTPITVYGQSQTPTPVSTPTADAQSVTVQQNTPAVITLTGSDPNGHSLAFGIVSTPAHGTLSAVSQINGISAQITYTPTAGFTGTDSFTFKVNNGTVDSNVATVSITINAATSVPPPNQPLQGEVPIPAGSFQMGDSFGNQEELLAKGYIDEQPVHTVNVSAFYMDQNDVKVGLWNQVTNWAQGHGYDLGPRSGSDNRGDNYPVTDVSWYEAVKWANARSELEGLKPAYYTDSSHSTVYRTGSVDLTDDDVDWSANGYRLPTEAEWEKAARGGCDGHRFPWCDTDTIDETQANYTSATGVFYYDHGPSGYNQQCVTGDQPFTCPVGTFSPNSYGLYDMAGNVWQWVWDWYDSGYYASSPATDPRGPTSGSDRVLRGGSWSSTAGDCRVANRRGHSPVYISNALGFRLVRTASSSSPPEASPTPLEMPIPAGSFQMGDSLDAESDAPVHTVTVNAFYIDKYDVTKDLWDKVASWAQNHGYDIMPGSAAGDGPNYPVTNVAWYDAVKWANARSEMEARTPVYYTDSSHTTVYRTGSVDVQNGWVNWTTNGYRLPTEAEWEKAARGGLTDQRYPWGDDIDCTKANYYYDEYGCVGHTTPVGSYQANGYGLYDMAGNVEQWVWDWYVGSYYMNSPGTDPRGPESGSYRAARGCGWNFYEKACRVAFRNRAVPDSRGISVGLGFRLVRTVP